LEHVRDTKGSEVGSLKEINRILKPNGVFVCYHFVNRYSWIEFVVRIFPKKHHHIFRYTDKMIKDFLSKAGLELVEVRRYGILPRNNLGRVKGKLKYSLILSRAWNLVDDILGAIFNPFCQNYYFVARKDGKF
jgi:hypothetical protein